MRWSRGTVEGREVRSLTGHRLSACVTVFPHDTFTPNMQSHTHLVLIAGYHHSDAISSLQLQIKSAFVLWQSAASINATFENILTTPGANADKPAQNISAHTYLFNHWLCEGLVDLLFPCGADRLTSTSSYFSFNYFNVHFYRTSQTMLWDKANLFRGSTRPKINVLPAFCWIMLQCKLENLAVKFYSIE